MFNVRVTKKVTISFKIADGVPISSDASVPLAPPEGFEVDDAGGRRSVSWRWISWRAIGALVFVALWDSILVGVRHFAPPLSTMPLMARAVLPVVELVGIYMTYSAVAHLVNRTTVAADRAKISVRHGPLPWLGGRDFAHADIERFECLRHDASEDSAWDPALTYSVNVVLRDGKRRTVVSSLTAAEQALFIERRLRM